MSSERVFSPFSSLLSWMRLQRFMASSLPALPLPGTGQFKVGRVWVRLRGLPDKGSKSEDEKGEWGCWEMEMVTGSAPRVSVSSSSSSSGDSENSSKRNSSTETEEKIVFPPVRQVEGGFLGA